MPRKREYPDQPVVGVGGVVIHGGRALLIRRGGPPLEGQWSIPGGTLELGETLTVGVARELLEETGVRVRVLDLIEVFERIFPGDGQKPVDTSAAGGTPVPHPKYHFVIVDYLCEALDSVPQAKHGSDVTDVAWSSEEELSKFGLTSMATRVLKKAFELSRARARQPREV
ncbi:MAG: NUDIX domain-containing protein [Acidobacteria bacterium]|nr:NUDIX domain-containing protein [Acidobacteriota bacterium]